MRALEPRSSGEVVNRHDGVRLHYEEFGPADAERTVLLLPTWSLVHSRVWKMQVPFLVQRGYRVVTFDGRGNGLSGRPDTGYHTDDFVRDVEAIVDHLAIRRAVLVAYSAGGRWAIQFSALNQERVEQLVLIAPATAVDGGPREIPTPFTKTPPDREGWNKYNAVHWREDYRDFVRWFASQIFTEPHSTKGQDDIIEWAQSTTHEMLTETVMASATPHLGEHWRAVKCPVLIVHGTEDAVIPLANSRGMVEMRTTVESAAATELAVLEECGHAPQVRDAVRTNLIIQDFLESNAPRVVTKELADARA